MTLYDLVNELIHISTNEIELNSERYEIILNYRETYRNSLRNTINKEIENSNSSSELNEIIAIFKDKLERTIVIALYRRYLWLEPTNTLMYQEFISYLGNSTTKTQQLLLAINNNDFHAAILLVEEIFDDTFNADQSLIKPIQLRSFVDIAKEYAKLYGSEGIASMTKTDAWNDRMNYLKEQIDLRINNSNINILELREFFTAKESLFIILNCELGLEIGKKYLAYNKYDREFYAYFCLFLNSWLFDSYEQLILQHIAANDFDNALKVVNSIVY
jgi:hypothetical protein